MTDKFPIIELKGNSHEIGMQHGTKLKERIHKTIEFYKDVTKSLDEDQRKKNIDKMLDMARQFKGIINNFDKNYVVEIEAIAEGAQVDPLWIYLLNSRTEIMVNLNLGTTECTAIYNKSTRTLAQNWDWAADFEDLSVILKIEYNDGHKIMMITEPGIIGKIGFNSSGLGVCLNFLQVQQELYGVPIHIILRKLLDSKSIEEGLDAIKGYMDGKSSNILIADADGNYNDIEFAGNQHYYLQNNKNYIIHTNHFIVNEELNFNPEDLLSSFSRYKTAYNIVENIAKPHRTIDFIKSVLLDMSNSELPICRNYIDGRIMKDVGTVCTVVMDLVGRIFHLTRGNPREHDFEIIPL